MIRKPGIKAWGALLIVIIALSSCSGGPVASPNSATTAAPLPELRIAFTSQPDFGDLPSLMAFELLEQEGYVITPTYFTSADLAVEALGRGDADFGNGPTRTYWAAMSKGADFRMIVEQVANEWTLVAVSAIQACADLDGQRFGTNATGGAARLMTEVYMRDNCPEAAFNPVTVPSSENRAAALLAGELDAASLELIDAIKLSDAAPDRFHILVNFTKILPQIKISGVYVNEDFAGKTPAAVQAYVRALLSVHRAIQADPGKLQAEAVKRLELSEEEAGRIVDAYMALGAWNVNGGLDDASINYSIDFLTDAGAIEPGVTLAQVADLSYLNAVLDEIGRK